MCGIAGYYSSRPYPPEVLRAMTRALRHRGPDAGGYHEAGAIHLGHRRLSIIDVANSAQPMVHSAARVVLTYNGELYNYLSLREALRGAGHRFETEGDTEVLLHALVEHGDDALPRLRGMFAFAAWDGARKRLLLARDQMGVKPLYYYWDGELFAFASELKALLQHPAVRRDLDLEAISLYLECQYIPAPRSIYQAIHKLPAAHALVLERGELRQFRYWSPDYREKLE